MKERLSSALVPTLGLVLFTVTGWALHRQLHHLGRRLAYPRVVLASFVAYVVSHNVGPAFLGGSASLRGPAPQPAGRRATRCASLDSSGDDLS